MIRSLLVATAAMLALGLFGPGAGVAADLLRPSSPAVRARTVCLDTSSPSYAADVAILRDLENAGRPFDRYEFDGSEGVSEKFFRFLSGAKCGIIMGYPVDLVNPDPPDGLALTKPYLSTAYVLVTRAASPHLASHATVGVGMATAPHFYLAGAFGNAPNYVADTFQTQENALDALVGKSIDGAMVWEPSLVRYRLAHPAARRLHVWPLNIKHGQWHIAALYPEADPAEAKLFNGALDRLARSGRLAEIARPYALEK